MVMFLESFDSSLSCIAKRSNTVISFSRSTHALSSIKEHMQAIASLLILRNG